MKNLVLCITAALIFLVNNEVFAVKVMSFNLWTGKPKKKESFIEIIKKADPDIVIINEANDPETFNAIADALGYERVLSVHNKYNVGVLSKYKIESQECYALETLAKSLVEIKVNIPGWDKPVYIFACHLIALNLPGRNKKRGVEMETILPYIQKRMGDHVIFAGDMNEESHLDRPMDENCISRSIESIGLIDSYRNYFKSPEVSPGFTHNILMIPTKRIDYIYISNGLEVSNSETLGKLFYSPWPSDHAALLSEINLKPIITPDAPAAPPVPETPETKQILASVVKPEQPKKKVKKKKIEVIKN